MSRSVLPASPDAERAILGAILLDNTAYYTAESITRDDFALDSHKRIFAAIARMLGNSQAVDIVTLVDELSNRHEVSTIGGNSYLASLIEGLPHRLSIDEYVRIVKEKSRLRQLINTCSLTITLAEEQSKDASELLATHEQRLLEIAAADKSGTGYNLIDLGELLARPEVPVDYVVDGLLVRGTVSVLVAKPKVGKSTLARWLALAVSRGTEFLGRSTKQGSCIYLALEERAEEVTADFRAMGADGSEPITVHADPVPEAAILTLIDLVAQQRPALVIIDPLIRMVSVKDEKAYAEVYAALGRLIDCARTTGTHILLLHHAPKAPRSDAIDSPLGSSAFGGAPSTLIVLKRTEAYRCIQTVQRIGIDMPETVLAFDPTTRHLSITGTREEVESVRLETEIIDYLEAGGEKPEEDILDHVEGRTTVKRKALRSLVEKGLVSRSGGGKKNDAFKYSFSRSQHIPGTRERESENGPQARVDIGEILVPENEPISFLVPDEKQGQNQTIFGSNGKPKKASEIAARTRPN